MPLSFSIVGASLAGATAAATLREHGFDGDITLIGAEPQPPYERPPLSKQYLRGETPFEKALVRPPTYYDEHRIEPLFGVRATRVEPAERTVHLETGRRVRYDKLLIATGVRNRRPPIPGLELEGVLDLRSVGDVDAIRHHIAAGKRAVVIGMGFIGCEVAASLRQMGVEVAAIESSPTPLFRVLGEDVGAVVAEIHREHGVDTIFDDLVLQFEGHGRVERVITKSGRRLECDFAVVGVGVEPVVDFLAESGIGIDNGILVDESCRTTVDGIYAAGDVANHWHPVFDRRMRVEHWQNAMQQGAAAARSMLGTGQPYDAIHWFWSDQYDANLQYAGFHHEWDRLVVRGSLQRRSFVAFYLNQGRIDAVVALNRGKDVRRAMPLIRSRGFVDPERLKDENVDLRSLAPAPTSGGQ
ncbi:MAG TPA: FAD-dependent oxidoreductase [Vicinamibacterales bacterium]|nr:FAD-dependent oxidoreductase [Vicinamibacterales bacterium]